ncbi:MAG: hypothetical protein ACEY3L_14950 [Wolbachia sp.]|uniref:hypothetical protein n=1 Tax=Wolbachia endosymbiont (group A) of Agelastica alni TaxID=3066130 RepID=UPI0031331D06
MTSTKLERSRMRRKVSRTVLKSSEEGRPSSLRQRYANQTSEEDLKKIVGSDIIIGRAYNELNQYNWSEEERFTYDQAKKREDDNLSCLKQKLNEGIQIGREKGRIEGKIEVAKTMLANNVDVDTIVKCTGLSISEIEELRNVLKEYLNDKI